MALNMRQFPFDNPGSYPEDADKNPTLFIDNQRRWEAKQLSRRVGYDTDDRYDYDMSDDERHG